jgi:hypothetical protein
MFNVNLTPEQEDEHLIKFNTQSMTNIIWRDEPEVRAAHRRRLKIVEAEALLKSTSTDDET